MARLSHIVIFASALVVCMAKDMLESDKHNYINCPRLNDAKIVLRDEELQISPKFLAAQKRTYMFPEIMTNPKMITCIMITDMAENDQGGYIEVVDGGIGNYDVTIYFTTQFGRGMHFRIRIYGQ